MQSRRSLLDGIGAVVSAILIAGCTSEQDDSPQAGVSADGDGGAVGPSTSCRMETRTNSEEIYDEVKSVSAGNHLTWNPDLEEDDYVTVEAVQIDGARPALTIEDSSGVTIASIEPDSNIRQSFRADSAGRYYIQLENEALINPGQWDIIIEIEREYEEEVCD